MIKIMLVTGLLSTINFGWNTPVLDFKPEDNGGTAHIILKFNSDEDWSGYHDLRWMPQFAPPFRNI